MAYNANKDLKLYYSIGEVAAQFGVAESFLRYWEKELSFISPKKTGRGIRQYTQNDIDNIRVVFHLVKEKGMTIEGARNALKHNRKNVDQTLELTQHLKNIREELSKMLEELERS